MARDFVTEPSPFGSSPLVSPADAATVSRASRGDLAAMMDALQGAHIDLGQPWHWDMAQTKALAEAALAARLRAAEPDWQPIETAPRDGTRVQGYGPHDTHGWYIDTIHCWQGHWTIKWMHGFGEPTHWRPLPEPPSQGIDAVGQDPKGLGAEHESPSAEGGAP